MTNAKDIRDIEMGGIYWVVTRPEDGRCVMNPAAPMFKAVWTNEAAARVNAKVLGKGHRVLKQVKD